MLSVHQLKPARGMILVQPAPKEHTTAGGIIIPDIEPKKLKDKVKMESGIVIAIGHPARLRNGHYKPWGGFTVNSRVFYTWTAGTEVKCQEGTFLLLLHNELLAFESEIE